jgi:uroporphyrinogen-III decarboxylase
MCEQIRIDVKNILAQSGRQTKLWFSTGGGMHPRTTVENMQCMIDAVNEYGRQ